MVYILFFVFAFVMGIILAITNPEGLETIDDESASNTFTFYIMAIGIIVSYYTFMESLFGRTIGKLITGTKVATEQGTMPNTKTAFLRSLSRLVPFEAFSFLGDEPRGWHDTWTDTWVVSNKS